MPDPNEAAAATPPAEEVPPVAVAGDAQEDFLTGTDINSQNIPPQLKPVYDNMNRHFQKKLQEFSESKKTGEALKKQYDELIEWAGNTNFIMRDKKIKARIDAIRERKEQYEPWMEGEDIPTGQPEGGEKTALTKAELDKILGERDQQQEQMALAAVEYQKFVREVGDEPFNARATAMGHVLKGMHADPAYKNFTPRQRLDKAWSLVGGAPPKPTQDKPPAGGEKARGSGGGPLAVPKELKGEDRMAWIKEHLPAPA